MLTVMQYKFIRTDDDSPLIKPDRAPQGREEPDASLTTWMTLLYCRMPKRWRSATPPESRGTIFAPFWPWLFMDQ